MILKDKKMPHSCEHCQETFKTRGSLIRHQTSTRFCLNIQRSKGLQVKDIVFSCSCGENFTQVGNLNRHKNICTGESPKTIININNGNINNGTIINQTNITINSTKPFTMADLTREYIIEKLTPVITKEVVKSGMGAIVEVIVNVLLQKDGKYCYYCTDPSRNKFTMLIDHNGEVIKQSDPHAKCLRGFICAPLQLIVGDIVNKNDNKAITKVYNEIDDLRRDGADFSTSLSKTLPIGPDGIPDDMKNRIDQDTNDISVQKTIASTKYNLIRRDYLKTLNDSNLKDKDINELVNKMKLKHDNDLQARFGNTVLSSSN